MSERTKSTGQAGTIALIGALLGIVVSVLLNAAYSATPDGFDLATPPWQPALEQIASPALTFAPAVEVYHLYGRVVLLVLAAFMVGLYGLHASQRAFLGKNLPTLNTWGYRLAMTGLVLTLFGNVGDYWVSLGETIGLVAFVVGTVVGLLLQAIGFLLLGVSGMRNSSLPQPVAWALILWFPFTLALFLVGMVNLPSAPVLALSLAWVVTSMFMVRSEGRRTSTA